MAAGTLNIGVLWETKTVAADCKYRCQEFNNVNRSARVKSLINMRLELLRKFKIAWLLLNKCGEVTRTSLSLLLLLSLV